MALSRRTFLGAGIGSAAVLPAVARSGEAPPPSPNALVFHVNGALLGVEVDPESTATALLRDQLGLTGTKRSCGAGACGACTISVDGTPVVSCLLPATSLQGRNVLTVEGIAANGVLHPVQKAFLAEDALQCGFCTPGFVIAAHDFCERWWASTAPGSVPSREQIATALAGHLCRCGAYEGIYRAVGCAAAGRFAVAEPPAPRVDGREKVTGAAKYTVDIRNPGQLVGRILRSPHASAVVRSLDFTAASAAPGVRAVFGLIEAGKRIRYAGQEIVAIAADNERQAQAALKLVQVVYDVLPAATSLEAARAETAPAVYARKDKPYRSSELPVFPAPWSNNVRGPVSASFGLRAGRARDVVAEPVGDSTRSVATWRTPVQAHTCMEPHAIVAWFKPEGDLFVWLSSQAVSWVAEDLAERFELRRDRVFVHAGYVGGGFGSKASFDPHMLAAIELSRAAGAPVAVVLDRHEEIATAGTRPGCALDLGLVASAGGEIEAITATAWGDSGVGVGHQAAGLLRLIYPSKNKQLADYDVVSHTSPGRPFRAPGGPPAHWAMECAVDEIAVARGEDPISLRRRWDPNPFRQRLFTAAEATSVWARRGKGANEGRFRRGVGVASAVWFYFTETATEVSLSVGPEGLLAATAGVDIGNGTRTVIAAGIREHFVGVDIGVRVGESTDVHGPMSAGSRTTASVFPAALDAARQLGELLAEDCAERDGLIDATATAEGVRHAGGLVPWKKVFVSGLRRTVVGRRRRDEHKYLLPIRPGGLGIGKVLTGGVAVAEVEVDTWTGRVRCLHVWSGLAGGRIVAPALAKNQAAGAVVQAVGYALYEDRRVDPKTGRVLTINMEDYRIPGIGDVPETEIHFDEEGLEWVNGGAVGISELATLATPAAIGNAVFDATGFRPRELPLHPYRMLAGLAVVS